MKDFLRSIGYGIAFGLAAAATLAVAQNRSVQLTQDPSGVITADSNNNLNIPNGKHLNSTANATPVVSACGGSPTITGTDMAAVIVNGTGATTSCTVTFSTAYATAPRCTAVLNATTNAGPFFIIVSTTTIVANYASEASDSWSYICIGT